MRQHEAELVRLECDGHDDCAREQRRPRAHVQARERIRGEDDRGSDDKAEDDERVDAAAAEPRSEPEQRRSERPVVVVLVDVRQLAVCEARAGDEVVTGVAVQVAPRLPRERDDDDSEDSKRSERRNVGRDGDARALACVRDRAHPFRRLQALEDSGGDALGDADHRLAADDLGIHVRRRRERETRHGEHLRQVLRASEQVHRLRDPRALHDGREHVLRMQLREDPLHVAEVLALDLVRGPREVGVERIEVLRRIDEMPADVVGVDDVRRLHHGRQRHAPVGDVEVVVRADAPAEPKQQADDAEVAAVVCGQS